MGVDCQYEWVAWWMLTASCVRVDYQTVLLASSAVLLKACIWSQSRGLSASSIYLLESHDHDALVVSTRDETLLQLHLVLSSLGHTHTYTHHNQLARRCCVLLFIYMYLTFQV